jgi:hypothetical protein
MNDRVSAPIRYRDFYDVPRIFLAMYRGQMYLFDCPFDEEVEDFPEIYHVYTMPPLPDEELDGSWADLPERALTHLGDIPIASVQFDPSARKSIDASILDELTARRAAAG